VPGIEDRLENLIVTQGSKYDFFAYRWKSIAHCRLQKSPPMFSDLSEISWVHFPTSCLKSMLILFHLVRLRLESLWKLFQLSRLKFHILVRFMSAWIVLLTFRNFLTLTILAVESREYGRRALSCWPRGTHYPQKLALTSPTSGGRSVGIARSWTQAREFSFSFNNICWRMHIVSPVTFSLLHQNVSSANLFSCIVNLSIKHQVSHPHLSN
jgi:hypothetical protein